MREEALKRVILLLSMVLWVSVRLFAITVEVEQVIDAPHSKFGAFFEDSAAYATNGELLFKSDLAFNLFVLKDSQWVPLIKEHRIEAYNDLQGEYWQYYSQFENSKTPNEFLFFAEHKPYPQENYRVFVDETGEVQAEWVSQEYYDAHRTQGLGPAWDMQQGLLLLSGARLRLRQSEDHVQLFLPEIVDRDGRVIYRIIDDFREGFVQQLRTIAVNPAQDRIAMVVSFRPEQDSPHYTPAMPQLKKLVVLKINYDATVTGSGVRMRRKPSPDGEILGHLTEGSVVTVFERSSDAEPIEGQTVHWYRVRTREGIGGWVYGAFLALSEEPIGADPPESLPVDSEDLLRKPFDTAEAVQSESATIQQKAAGGALKDPIIRTAAPAERESSRGDMLKYAGFGALALLVVVLLIVRDRRAARAARPETEER